MQIKQQYINKKCIRLELYFWKQKKKKPEFIMLLKDFLIQGVPNTERKRQLAI